MSCMGSQSDHFSLRFSANDYDGYAEDGKALVVFGLPLFSYTHIGFAAQFYGSLRPFTLDVSGDYCYR